MATLYFTSGTGNWTNTAKWSTTADGLTPANAIPTSADDVIFNSVSGNCTLPSASSGACKNLTTEASYTGVIAPANSTASFTFSIYGNITIATLTHFNAIGNSTATTWNLYGTNNNINVPTTSNFYCKFNIINIQGNAVYTLLNHILVVNNITIYAGATLNTNGKNITVTASAGTFGIQASGTTGILNVAAGSTLNLPTVLGSNGAANILTVNADTDSTINIGTVPDATAARYVNVAASSVIRNLVISPNTYAGQLNYFGCNNTTMVRIFTITNLTMIGATQTATLKFGYNSGTAWPIKNITIKGNATYKYTVTVNTGTSPFVISSNNGKIDCNYITLSYCNGTGTSIYYAGSGSTNGGNNTNWLFSNYVAPAADFNPLMFGFGHII